MNVACMTKPNNRRGMLGLGASADESETTRALRDLIGLRYLQGQRIEKASLLVKIIGEGFPISSTDLAAFNRYVAQLREWNERDMRLQDEAIDPAISFAVRSGSISQTDVPRGLRSQDAGGWFRAEDTPTEPPRGLGLAFIVVIGAIAIALAAVAAGTYTTIKLGTTWLQQRAELLAQEQANRHALFIQANEWRIAQGKEPLIPQTPNGPQSDIGDKALKAGGGVLLAAVAVGLLMFLSKRGAA